MLSETKNEIQEINIVKTNYNFVSITTIPQRIFFLNWSIVAQYIYKQKKCLVTELRSVVKKMSAAVFIIRQIYCKLKKLDC